MMAHQPQVSMQIERETALESFDEKRVNNLKAQLVQFERQVVMMTRALSSYKQKVDYAEGVVQQELNMLRGTLGEKGNTRNTLTLTRSEVLTHIKLLEDALEKFSSSQSSTESSWVGDTFNSNTSFLKRSSDPTIKDISCGNTKHINLTQVTKLEQRLSQLYGELCAFQCSLHVAKSAEKSPSPHPELTSSLQQACEDLQVLSFMVPNIPWANRICLPEVTADTLMKALPKLTYAKHQDVKDLLSTVLKLSEHRYRLLMNKTQRLELTFSHLRANAEKTKEKAMSFSEGVMSSFNDYHQSLVHSLVLPLTAVLQKFTDLSTLPSDENLKDFLNDFREKSSHLSQICTAISEHNVSEEGLKLLESSSAKELRKAMKQLKLPEQQLEDEQNRLLQLEHETRVALAHRLSKLPESKTTISPSSWRSTPSEKSVSKSRGAASFLSKLDQVDSSVDASQASSTHSELSKSADPVWLQEMKEDLSAAKLVSKSSAHPKSTK